MMAMELGCGLCSLSNNTCAEKSQGRKSLCNVNTVFCDSHVVEII